MVVAERTSFFSILNPDHLVPYYIEVFAAFAPSNHHTCLTITIDWDQQLFFRCCVAGRSCMRCGSRKSSSPSTSSPLCMSSPSHSPRPQPSTGPSATSSSTTPTPSPSSPSPGGATPPSSSCSSTRSVSYLALTALQSNTIKSLATYLSIWLFVCLVHHIRVCMHAALLCVGEGDRRA